MDLKWTSIKCFLDTKKESPTARNYLKYRRSSLRKVTTCAKVLEFTRQLGVEFQYKRNGKYLIYIREDCMRRN